VALPDDTDSSILPGHRTGDTDGEEYRRADSVLPDCCRYESTNRMWPLPAVPECESHSMVWLSWKACGRVRGLRKHRFNPDGSIVEMHDPAPEPRRKPKAISSRQWRRC